MNTQLSKASDFQTLPVETESKTAHIILTEEGQNIIAFLLFGELSLLKKPLHGWTSTSLWKR